MQQAIELVGILHDRDALEAREKRRRFIAGDGFVAWPGPALRTFIDEFIVNNRMTGGGFVIGGADGDALRHRPAHPVLHRRPRRDRAPAAVRAIPTAAPKSDIHEVSVEAGHFGIVGSRSLAVTWPTVREWCLWRDGDGEQPAHVGACRATRRPR